MDLFKNKQKKWPSKPEVDYLDEDEPIRGQKFFLLSYILTDDTDAPCLFKVRGTFNTIPECEEHIKLLRKTDTFTHIFTCETGKWGSLYTQDRLAEVIAEEKDFYSDYSYSNTETNETTKTQVNMNNIMKTFKEKISESKEDLEKRLKQGDEGNIKILHEDPMNKQLYAETQFHLQAYNWNSLKPC